MSVIFTADKNSYRLSENPVRFFSKYVYKNYSYKSCNRKCKITKLTSHFSKKKKTCRSVRFHIYVLYVFSRINEIFYLKNKRLSKQTENTKLFISKFHLRGLTKSICLISEMACFKDIDFRIWNNLYA